MFAYVCVYTLGKRSRSSRTGNDRPDSDRDKDITFVQCLLPTKAITPANRRYRTNRGQLLS